MKRTIPLSKKILYLVLISLVLSFLVIKYLNLQNGSLIYTPGSSYLRYETYFGTKIEKEYDSYKDIQNLFFDNDEINQIESDFSNTAVFSDFHMFLLFSLIFFVIFYFFSKYNFAFANENEKNTPINSEQNQTKIKSKENFDNKNLKSIETLEELKESGLLTENEYQEKVQKLRDKIQFEQIKDSDEYQKLKDLFDKGILSSDEFETKLKLLQNKFQENNHIFSFEDQTFRIVDGFSEGIGLAINSELDYGFVDEKGKIVIDFIFEHAENFKNDTAKVRYNGEFRMIDKKGNFI